MLFATAAIALSAAPCAHARPPRGFHTGPYLQFVSGARDTAYDTNLVSGVKQGHDIDALFGAIFGWNVNDTWSAELHGHYSSPGTESVQEHLINVRLQARYSLITEALTHFQSLRILPYVSAGPLVQLNAMASAPGTTENRAKQWGYGLSFGTGVSFQFWHDYAYISVGGFLDLIHRQDLSQDVSGVDTLVYRGGNDLDWSSIGAIGVHF